MPHTPSAAKRLRKSEARRKRNRAATKKLKSQRRAADAALKAGDAAKTATEFMGGLAYIVSGLKSLVETGQPLAA